MNPSRLRLLQPYGPCLCPTLLVRAYEGSEQADGEELTPGNLRKLSIELAGKRATLAETGAWTELLRMHVARFDVLLGRHKRRWHAHPAAEHDTEGGHDARFRQDGLLQHSGGFKDPAEQCARRRTRKPLQRYTRWLLLILTNTRLRGSKCNVQRSSRPLRNSRLHHRSWWGEWLGKLCWRPSQDPVVGAMLTLLPLDGLKVDQLCYASGYAPAAGQWFHTAQRSYGRRPRLPHLIPVPRNQSQGSKCRSHAHESFAQLRWRRC